MIADIRLLSEALDPNPAVDSLIQQTLNAGGIATFVGKVRGGDAGKKAVQALELSHYEPLTLPGMQALGGRAIERFDLMGLVMLHRIGQLGPGDPIVCVSAASRHRRDALQAVDYCMDHLKSCEWFWKRELRDAEWHWIEPRGEDHGDLARWAK